MRKASSSIKALGWGFVISLCAAMSIARARADDTDPPPPPPDAGSSASDPTAAPISPSETEPPKPNPAPDEKNLPPPPPVDSGPPATVMTSPPDDTSAPPPPGPAVSGAPETASDTPPIPTPEPTDHPRPVVNPRAPIEAKSYDITVIRPSKSGRVYLLQKDTSDLPEPGRLVLLKEEGQPVMGFRVLKQFPESKQVAMKQVRTYSTYDTLPPDHRYRAFEKTGDITSLPSMTPQDSADLKEIEGGVGASAPAEEPGGPPPPPSPKSTMLTSEPAPTVEENDRPELRKEYFPHWLSIEFGELYNKNAPGGAFQKGGGLRYGLNLGTPTFTLEGGFFFYKILTEGTDPTSGSTVSQAFTIIPLDATLRLNIPFSPSMTGYIYGGFLYNIVASELNATTDQIASLSGLAPAVGAGLLAQVGPNWYLKFNLGIDILSLGVTMRF